MLMQTFSSKKVLNLLKTPLIAKLDNIETNIEKKEKSYYDSQNYCINDENNTSTIIKTLPHIIWDTSCTSLNTNNIQGYDHIYGKMTLTIFDCLLLTKD